MSNGAAMALRVAARQPARFAAVAAVRAISGIRGAHRAAASLLFIAGDRDPLNPLAGATVAILGAAARLKRR